MWSPRPAGVVVGGFCGNEDCWRSESVAAGQEAVAMKKRTTVLMTVAWRGWMLSLSWMMVNRCDRVDLWCCGFGVLVG